MLNIVPVFRVLGGLIIAFAGSMLVPLLVEFDPLHAPGSWFVLSALATAFVGMAMLALSPAGAKFELNRRQGFLITALSWTLFPAFGALPLLGYGLSYTDAYFEAASALTTTGSTVMTGLDTTHASILLWRSVMQSIGGVGVIVLGMIMMPFLKVAGMQLFHTESSDTSEKIVAKAFDLSVWIVSVYLVMLMLCIIAFRALGMSWFDATNHGMTTIATGGFSTHDASFGYFSSLPTFETLLWCAVCFMALSAMPFVAFIRLARGSFREFIGDIQIRAFLVFLAAVSLLLAVTRSVRTETPFWESISTSAFNVTSIVTTTGYASEDYQLWGPFAVGAFFILTFVGGCSGSTTGGIKIYRFQILSRLAAAHLSRLVSPSRVNVVMYHERRVDDDVAFAILAFLVMMLFTVSLATFVQMWVGVDLVSAFTGASQAFANVGPGLGPVIGPAGNFATLPDIAKWVLAVTMILGRLEFFTILVLLTPTFWRL